MPTKHLDLGCGRFPRNPYGQQELHGVDVRLITESQLPGVKYHEANLVMGKLPFADDMFDSVSAYDFIEHVPRILTGTDGALVYPFITLMNEVHRILRPGGRFFALTPCYPSKQVFQDPTHVNFLTIDTHEYFCGEKPLGRMYGFQGKFKALLARRTFSSYGKERIEPSLSDHLKHLRKRIKGDLTHVAWELEAVKAGTADRD
jgi:SAM-dependent methyltransferase